MNNASLAHASNCHLFKTFCLANYHFYSLLKKFDIYTFFVIFFLSFNIFQSFVLCFFPHQHVFPAFLCLMFFTSFLSWSYFTIIWSIYAIVYLTFDFLLLFLRGQLPQYIFFLHPFLYLFFFLVLLLFFLLVFHFMLFISSLLFLIFMLLLRRVQFPLKKLGSSESYCYRF